MQGESPKILAITGPTATGKTKLGVELALENNGEVVSADSMQIYRRFNIGTAKPGPEETQSVPHHMIDIIEPSQDYSVAEYVKQAGDAVDDILARGKLPILVGGTGLYIDSLISGRSFARTTSDKNIRRDIEARYEHLGGEVLLKELEKFDPERAAKLSPADRKRIVRAHEVYTLTGKSLTQHDKETKALPPRYDAQITALNFSDRQHLYDRIDKRVDLMMEMGLLAEVRELLDSGVSPQCTAMQAIGYREFLPYFSGEQEIHDVVEKIKQNSRRYSKRQLTWLRGRDDINWQLLDGC